MFRSLAAAFLILCVTATTALAGNSQWDRYTAIKIFDNVSVHVDDDTGTLDPAELKAKAQAAMTAAFPNVPLAHPQAQAGLDDGTYRFENVGYVIFDVMAMETPAGTNIYHVDMELGTAPRNVLWDKGVLGIAPTKGKLDKVLRETIRDLFTDCVADFKAMRGE
jgi:hypothetical protein